MEWRKKQVNHDYRAANKSDEKFLKAEKNIIK